MKVYERLFIGGEWVPSSGTSTIEIINPTTEEVAGKVPDSTEADIDRAVAAARQAFDHGPWPKMTPTERAAVLTKVNDAMKADMQGIAELISTEMGAPVSWGLFGQALAPTMIFDYYTDLATKYPFDELKAGLLGSVLVAKEPVGVVAAITPWNVPLFTAVAKLAPALVAGCTVVFKPSPETPLDAFRLAELFEEAGLPKGVLSVVPAGREVGEYLVRHRERQQSVVHGIDGGRQEDRCHLWRAPEALQLGAGGQVRRHLPRRRQCGRGHPHAHAQCPDEQRRGVHCADSHPGAEGPLPRGRRRPGGHGVGHEGGRRPRPHYRGRPAGGIAPA